MKQNEIEWNRRKNNQRNKTKKDGRKRTEQNRTEQNRTEHKNETSMLHTHIIIQEKKHKIGKSVSRTDGQQTHGSSW